MMKRSSFTVITLSSFFYYSYEWLTFSVIASACVPMATSCSGHSNYARFKLTDGCKPWVYGTVIWVCGSICRAKDQFTANLENASLIPGRVLLFNAWLRMFLGALTTDRQRFMTTFRRCGRAPLHCALTDKL